MPGPLAAWKQLGLSALVIAGGWWAWTDPDAARELLGMAVAEEPAARATKPRPGVPVIVAAVARASDDLVLEVVGTGKARRSITLRPEASGKVVGTALGPNTRFEAGDVLLSLDDTAERLALSLAETRLAEARRVSERYTRLQDQGATATARLDEVVTAAEIARLEVERAREALQKRQLRAPFAGVSGLPAIEKGAWIDTGTEIASYDDRQVILVEVDLPEAALARIRPGLGVSARTATVPGRSFDGTVAGIDSRVDPQSRTARIRVAIPNREDLLRPGTSFVVRLELPGPEYPVVPELAVQFSGGGLHVWRIADGAAEKVEVRMIRRRDGMVIVDGPLDAGDPVVIEGTQRLEAGKKVNVTGGDPAALPAS